MPIIPLVKNNPVADLPGAVLNRERGPVVDRSAQGAEGVRLAKASAMPELPIELANNGLAPIGRAIAQAGDLMSALAMKRREAENDVQIAEADNTMIAERGDYDAWRERNPDPTTWEAEWGKRVNKLREGVSKNPRLHHEAREQIGMRMERFAVQHGSDVTRAAAGKTFELAKLTFLATANQAIESQDAGRFDEAITSAESKGYISPHETERLRQAYTATGERKKKEARASLYNEAQNGVIAIARTDGESAAIEQIDTRTDLEESEREQLRRTARQVSGAQTADAVDSLADYIASGTIQSDAAIDAIESPFLSPKLREDAKKAIHQRNEQAEARDREQNGERNFVELLHRVQDYDRSKDPEMREAFKLRRELSARVGSEDDGYLRQVLWAKVTAKPPELKPSEEIKGMVSSSLRVMFDAETGAIPWKRREIGADGKPKVVEDRNASLRAIEAQTRVLQRFNEWQRLNPQDAQDPGKASKKLREFLPEGTRAGALETIQKQFQQRGPSAILRGYSGAEDLKDKLPTGLKSHAQDFIDAARETGLNPRVLAAISALETGGGTSKAFREKLNAMGVSNDSGPIAMPSVRDSIFKMARTLASERGPYAKARTLDEIGAIYAPPGAGNDFKGTNAGWAEGVRSWLARL